MSFPANRPPDTAPTSVLPLYFPVNNPPQSGLYAAKRIFVARSAGTNSASTFRVSALYIP